MTSTEVAKRLRELVTFHLNRMAALGREFQTLASGSAWINTGRSRARRAELRDMFECIPAELAREAVRVLKQDPTHAEHRRSLSRVARDRNFESVVREIMRIVTALDPPRSGGTMVRIPEPPNLVHEVRRIADAVSEHLPGLGEIGAAIQDKNATDDLHVETLVTLDQISAIIGVKKRTLERHLLDGKLPAPDFRGGDGKPHKWAWSKLRTVLEKEYARVLPERFPGTRII